MNRDEKIEIRFLGLTVRIAAPTWKSIIILAMTLLFLSFMIQRGCRTSIKTVQLKEKITTFSEITSSLNDVPGSR